MCINNNTEEIRRLIVKLFPKLALHKHYHLFGGCFGIWIAAIRWAVVISFVAICRRLGLRNAGRGAFGHRPPGRSHVRHWRRQVQILRLRQGQWEYSSRCLALRWRPVGHRRTFCKILECQNAHFFIGRLFDTVWDLSCRFMVDNTIWKKSDRLVTNISRYMLLSIVPGILLR